jgi:hypothetical protein
MQTCSFRLVKVLRVGGVVKWTHFVRFRWVGTSTFEGPFFWILNFTIGTT